MAAGLKGQLGDARGLLMPAARDAAGLGAARPALAQVPGGLVGKGEGGPTMVKGQRQGNQEACRNQEQGSRYRPCSARCFGGGTGCPMR